MSENNIIYELIKLERFYTTQVEVVKAIDGINLTISKGEFLAIFGPSGSGKTTFLNLLAGLDKPTGGSIYFSGQDLTRFSDSKLCEFRQQEIGIIFQFYNMHPSFSACRNIEYPMMIAGISYRERKERALSLLRQFNLYEKRDHAPVELSGGEKQRVGIARALANNPQVIIADEPTGDLDSENAEMIIKMLVDINKQEKTIVMVTHDESLLTPEMRIIHLIDGKVFES